MKFSLIFIFLLFFIPLTLATFGYDSRENALTVTTNLFEGNLTNLSQLADTNIPSPSDDDILTYDSATGKWIDEPASSAGDTNETTRFNALVATDCAAGTLVISIQTNGTVNCATDSSGSPVNIFDQVLNTTSNVTFFNISSQNLNVTGKVGIGTDAPLQTLHVI